MHLFRNLTPVVKNLIIINVLFFLATVVLNHISSIHLEDLLSLYYWTSPHFHPYQIITSMFMHATFWHIFFNMFGLFIFGPMLEQFWGGKRFFIYYMVCGIGAVFIYNSYVGFDLHHIQSAVDSFSSNPTLKGFEHFFSEYVPMKDLNVGYRNAVSAITAGWTSNPGNAAAYASEGAQLMNEFVKFKSNIPMLGASGAIYGVLLAFGYLFPNTELMLLFPPIPMKAKWFVLIFGGIEVFEGFDHSLYDNTAHFAHMGGMLFGFILLLIWQKSRKKFY